MDKDKQNMLAVPALISSKEKGATIECCLRSMTSADLTEVISIEQLCYSHPWREVMFQRELDNPLSHVIVCVVEDNIVGYLCFWNVASEIEIHNVATRPDWQGMGVGRALMSYLFSCIESNGIQSAFLEVRTSNDVAIKLYEKYLFRAVDRRKNYYSDGEDALLMAWHRADCVVSKSFSG